MSLAGLLAGAIPFATSAAVAPPWDPFFAQPATIHDFGLATRPLGVAAGDFTSDGRADLFVGRVNAGAAAFTLHRGNGDGTFQAPTAYTFRVQVHNQWTFRPGDLNGDNKLDLVFGSTATAASSGCTVSPIPVGGTCATAGGQTVTVNPGDVRVLYGNGDGTFQDGAYFVSGLRFAGGQLVGRIGATGAGSFAIGDIDGDADQDVIAGGVDGANSIIKVLRNDGAGVFTQATIATVPTAANPGSPIYFPSTSAQNSPYGLALGDADADGDLDLFVGDRALYVYLFKNDGSGGWTLTPGSTVVSGTRPNVYLAHESYRAAVGFTPSLAAGDINGDGKADLVLGLQSGAQTPASGTAHDGELVLDVSNGSGHGLFGTLADVGTMARGTSVVDANGDGALDIIAGEYDGKLRLLRQLAPIDSDGDGVSDYVDNAPNDPNAARIDMNTDGAYNSADQLDNDFDTVLGNPEDSSTWVRKGDPADADDDNDGVNDGADNCVFVANGGQSNVDGDAQGDACDPLDNRDSDGDGIPNGPLAGDPLYELARAASIKWSQGDTHFVIRIDALGRLFQNEFTGLMADAAVSSPSDWAAKCPGMYNGTDPSPDCSTLPGGKEVPVTLVTIPRLLWTDPEVIDWINDRNDNPLFDLGQHGTYHNSGPSNTMLGDWASDPNRNFFSCDTCGLTTAESFELLKVGYDTLMGNYGNKWLVDSGAAASSPKIDWSDSANPLLSYAPPFNASDEEGRRAVALLGLKAWSASVHEEGGGSLGHIFSPNENAFEQFDKFGLFHSSADLEFEPPVTSNGSYNAAAYADYLAANTQDGGLNTWLIEEVEWSGRPCNDLDRLADLCNGQSNRENNSVYLPRWQGWMQLLDYVKSYEGGVAMTMAEVALAKAFDNAPTVANPDQADTDHDGIGDVIDDATLTLASSSLSRNEPGTIAATLENGAGQPIAGQTVTFSFDADGDSTDETYSATTDAAGVASASVTATRPVGSYSASAAWDGVRATAQGSGSVTVADATSIALDASNPTSGQVTDSVTVGATLRDSDGQPLAGRSLTFTIGSATGSATTDAGGHAATALTLAGPTGGATLSASFAGESSFGASAASAPFQVNAENTTLSLADAVATNKVRAVARATLREADGAPLAGRTIAFQVQEKVRGKVVWTTIGTAVTDASGVAALELGANDVSKQPRPIQAIFAGDASFLGSSAAANAYRK